MQDRFVKRYENFSQNLYLFSPATAVFPLTYRHLWNKIQFNPGTGLYGRRKDTIIIYPGVAQLVARLLWEQEHSNGPTAPNVAYYPVTLQLPLITSVECLAKPW